MCILKEKVFSKTKNKYPVRVCWLVLLALLSHVCPAPAHLSGSHAVPGAAVQLTNIFTREEKTLRHVPGWNSWRETENWLHTQASISYSRRISHTNVDNFIFDIFIFGGDRICTGNPLSFMFYGCSCFLNMKYHTVPVSPTGAPWVCISLGT